MVRVTSDSGLERCGMACASIANLSIGQACHVEKNAYTSNDDLDARIGKACTLLHLIHHCPVSMYMRVAFGSFTRPQASYSSFPA